MAAGLRFEPHITRRMLQAEPGTLFVFGDNLQRRGLGGQAKEMRDEPNAVGLPTKRSPATDPAAYLSDADLPAIQAATRQDLRRLAEHLLHGGAVVWPAAGIGTGRAELAERAPAIAHWYATFLEALRSIGQPPATG